MQHFVSLFAVVSLAAVASAQSTVLPNGYASTEGNSSSAYPFGRGNSACRVQYIYDSANMVAAGMNAPLFINTIEWRANTAATTAGGTHAGAGVTLKIGTCAFDHLAVSNTFDTNFATSSTFNLNPVTVAAGAGTTPNNYTTSLAVPGGYLFDPNGGVDLVIEISFPAGTFTGTAANTTAASMDLQSSVGCGGSRLFTSTNTGATATPQLNLAAIIRLGWTAAPGAASNQSYGSGCGAAYQSFYQTWADALSNSTALSNTSISLTNAGSFYVASNGGGTFVPPSVTATNLTLGDDTEAPVTLSAPMPYPGGTTSSLVVCSNGFISTATGNGINWVPTPAEMLNMSQTVWALCWSDWAPQEATSGPILFEEIGGIAYVTWNNVERYLTTEVNPGTFQAQFDVATGNVKYVYGNLPTIGSGTGAPALVGYSPGGASGNPGPIDLATGLPWSGVPVEILALNLGAASRPILNTSVTYSLSNVNPSALLNVIITGIGGVDPGINLAGQGMPGCFQYVDLTISSVSLVDGTTTPPFASTLSIPNSIGLVGLPLDLQGASLVPGFNPLGVTSSNAVASTVGSL